MLGVEERLAFGTGNLARTDRPWASIRQAEPGVLGDADGAPYDRILVSAMADELPLALVDQLAHDGVLVVPVDGTMLRVTNPGAVATEHGRYRFVRCAEVLAGPTSGPAGPAGSPPPRAGRGPGAAGAPPRSPGAPRRG